MSATTPINVRLTQEEEDAVLAAAELIKTSKSAVIRMCVELMLPKIRELKSGDDLRALVANFERSSGHSATLKQNLPRKPLVYKPPPPSAPRTTDEPPEEIRVTWPEIPLLHAAAGAPAPGGEGVYDPGREIEPGRFAVRLHGKSMEPRFPDGSIVILRRKENLDRQTLRKKEIYLFDHAGERTLKQWQSRAATPQEIEAGLSYTSRSDGKTKVHVLRSLNPDHPDIVVTDDDYTWLGWLDPEDNRSP